MVALGRVQKLVKSMIGTLIAEASLLKFVLRLHQALEVWERKATQQLLEMPTINVDETSSFRVERKNHWIHVYSSGDITLEFLHRNRGKAAGGHQYYSALWRCHHSRLLVILSVVSPLRSWAVRFTSAA